MVGCRKQRMPTVVTCETGINFQVGCQTMAESDAMYKFFRTLRLSLPLSGHSFVCRMEDMSGVLTESVRRWNYDIVGDN